MSDGQFIAFCAPAKAGVHLQPYHPVAPAGDGFLPQPFLAQENM